MTTQAKLHPSKGNLKMLRQDRLSITDLKCLLCYDNKEWEIFDYSAFGLAIISQSEFPDGLEINEASIKIENYEIAKVSLVKVRQEATASGIKTGFEITSDPLSLEKFNVFPEVWRILRTLEQEHKLMDVIPEAFTGKVFEVKYLLEMFEKKIMQLEASHSFTSRIQIQDFEDTIINVSGNSLFKLWISIHDEMAIILKNESDEVVKLSYDFFREQLKSLIYQSPFANRCFQKPLGYAGDYEMMNLIYYNEGTGKSLFARCMEKCFAEHAESQAVRNRVEYLLGKIKETIKHKAGKKITILSVACGPAMEIQKYIAEAPQSELSNIEIHLLDQDHDALKHVQRRLRKIATQHNKKVEVKLISTSIKKVLFSGLEFGEYDLIYSAGLFDYFTDQVATMAARALFNSLGPDSKLIIGNFDVSSPFRFGMSLVFDWNLIYRTEGDLLRLFEMPEAKLHIEKEERGINLFCTISKA